MCLEAQGGRLVKWTSILCDIFRTAPLLSVAILSVSGGKFAIGKQRGLLWHVLHEHCALNTTS